MSTASADEIERPCSSTAPSIPGSNTPKAPATTAGVTLAPIDAARPHTYPSKKPWPSDTTASAAGRDHQPSVAMGSRASRSRRAGVPGSVGAGMGVAGGSRKCAAMAS